MTTLALGAALLALASHAPAQPPHARPGCHKFFTVAQTRRTARRIFAGTQHVSLSEYKHLGRMEMCQRNPHAQAYVRWYDRHQRVRWRHRRVSLAQAIAAPVAPAANGLVQCIVHAESGGDPQAVNASGHMGLGQWDEPTWLADGGGRYASTPLGASYGQQLTIIEEQVAAGQIGQWTNYDPC